MTPADRRYEDDAREWVDETRPSGCSHEQPGGDYERPCHECLAALIHRLVDEAVAEEWKALREWAVANGMRHYTIVELAHLLAALDARKRIIK